MKKIIVILVCAYSSLMMTQTIKPLQAILDDSFLSNPNTYYKDTDNRLAQCVGTWEYNNGSDYFRITFSLVKELANVDYTIYEDRLFSKFIYKKDGVVKYDNYGTTTYPVQGTVNTKPGNISSAFVVPFKIAFLYIEPSATDGYRPGHESLYIQYVAGNPSKLIWKRTTSPYGTCMGDLEKECIDETPCIIPTEMTLTKIN